MFYMECCIGVWAGVAQLVEHKLPKLGVASSNLVARSRHSRVSDWTVKYFFRVISFVSCMMQVALKVGLPTFFISNSVEQEINK